VLGGHLIRYADQVLGYDAVLCLIGCLLVTPFITVAGAKIAKLRIWYGLWMFAIGVVAVMVHLAVATTGMTTAVAGTAVAWTGLMIVVLMIPMAASSGTGAQKALGKEWKRWQRPLVWIVWAVVAVHLAALRDWLPLIAFGAATVPLLAVRQGPLRRRIKAWRSGGYSTGRMWAVMILAAYLLAGGVAFLALLEVLACARAVTLR
jgi:DMSO/TMAO reductase YedYZ heme-binding membrane subunit